MTKEEQIDWLCRLRADLNNGVIFTPWNKEFTEALNKALEQEPSADVMAIHTQGLDEGIRCAMCTNSMKSDSGCDGGCIVNEGMYKKVMETINNHIFSQPTSEDCVSREQEPKTGHWIADVDRWGDIVTTVNGYRCSECNAFDTDKDNYCPSCGLKMVEPQESEDKE